MWESYAKQLDRSGTNLAHVCWNGHELNINPLIPEGHGGFGGHQFINLGKLPNHWTDRDHIWHTYIQIHQVMDIS